MARSPARHQGSRLLALVMSVVMLVPKVIHAYDITKNNNLVVYWGQDASGQQKDLSTYCDGTIDNIVIAFLDDFGTTGGGPQIDLGNICSVTSAGSNEGPGCSSMSTQIEQCQASGTMVSISLGGEASQVGFTDDSQAQKFADVIWGMFLGGSGPERPFGDAVFDGIDLDIESGDPTGYAAFVNQLREHAKGSSKPLYITAAPQCPFPDTHIGAALNNAPFDAVYVQFFDNYCGLSNPEAFNFNSWDEWAKSGSANPDIKVYIGALAGPDGTGYVSVSTLANYITQAQSTWSSFGGVMLWEASLATANNDYDVAVKKALLGGRIAPSSPSADGGPSSSPTVDGVPSSSPTVGGYPPSSTVNGVPSSSHTRHGAHPGGAPSSSPTGDEVPPSSLTGDGVPPSSPTGDGTPSSSPTVDGAPPSTPTADGGPTSPPYPDEDPSSSASAYDVASTGEPTRHHRPSNMGSHRRKRFGANKHSHWT